MIGQPITYNDKICIIIEIRGINILHIQKHGGTIMDGLYFKILKKICLFLFAGDIFVHAVIGASAVNGIVRGGISMSVMLILVIILNRLDRDNKVKKNRKKRQRNEKGVSSKF